MPRTYSATNADIRHRSANTRGAFARALTALVASCTMNWERALSSAVRAFGLHPKGRPFKSDSAHHCDAAPFSGDVVQLVRTLPTSPSSSQTQPLLIRAWTSRLTAASTSATALHYC